MKLGRGLSLLFPWLYGTYLASLGIIQFWYDVPTESSVVGIWIFICLLWYIFFHIEFNLYNYNR